MVQLCVYLSAWPHEYTVSKIINYMGMGQRIPRGNSHQLRWYGFSSLQYSEFSPCNGLEFHIEDSFPSNELSASIPAQQVRSSVQFKHLLRSELEIKNVCDFFATTLPVSWCSIQYAMLKELVCCNFIYRCVRE